MTINEKINELRGKMTHDMKPDERERLLLDIMTYQYIIDRSALTGQSDITAVSDLMKSNYSYDFVQYGIFSEMCKNMTNEAAVEAAYDVTPFYKSVSDKVRKYYDDAINANEEKFKKTHDVVLNPSEYVEKVINNGWVMGDEDRRLVRAIYRVGRYGGSDKYIELYDKMLNTDVKTVEARKKMLEEIKAAEPELEGMIFNGISKSDAVTSNIKKFIAEPTQQELDQKIKENEERVEKLISLRDEAERLSAKKPEGKAVNGNALIDELSRYTKIVQQDQANKAKNEVNVNAERVQQGFAMQQ